MPEILAELRDRRYSPAAWLRFLERSFQRSIEDARSEPALLRSLLRQSALLEGMALTVLLWHCRRHHAYNGVRQTCKISIAVLLQQSFVALHLGMAQPRRAAPRFATLGAASMSSKRPFPVGRPV